MPAESESLVSAIAPTCSSADSRPTIALPSVAALSNRTTSTPSDGFIPARWMATVLKLMATSQGLNIWKFSQEIFQSEHILSSAFHISEGRISCKRTPDGSIPWSTLSFATSLLTESFVTSNSTASSSAFAKALSITGANG